MKDVNGWTLDTASLLDIQNGKAVYTLVVKADSLDELKSLHGAAAEAVFAPDDDAPPPVRVEPAGCNIFTQQDEKYCSTCGLRWSADKEKPPCPNL